MAREERCKARGAATPWEMRVASTPAARRRVSEFAYRILSADLGGRIAAADHAARRLDDPMDDVALHLIASRQSRIEGTLRVMIGAGPVLSQGIEIPAKSSWTSIVYVPGGASAKAETVITAKPSVSSSFSLI